MNRRDFILVMIKLIVGGMQFISFKALSDTKSINLGGNLAKFSRPYFVATILFGSVILSLIPYLYKLSKTPKTVSAPKPSDLVRMGVPGLSDAVAQILTQLGTIRIPVSLVMVLKGSRVVFSAILSIFMLRRKLYPYHWASVFLCLVGLTLTSISQLINDLHGKGSIAIGITMILAAEAFRSVRIVSEEQYIKKYHYNEFLMIGVEGVYGFVVALSALLIVNALPGSDFGSVENLDNTNRMIASSTVIIVILSLLPIWVNGMYLSGVFVTKYLSAVYNALATVLTAVVVWLYEIIIFYSVGNGYGQPWTSSSYMQLGGFMLILVSTLMYDKTLKIPLLFSYQPIEEEAKPATIAVFPTKEDANI